MLLPRTSAPKPFGVPLLAALILFGAIPAAGETRRTASTQATLEKILYYEDRRLPQPEFFMKALQHPLQQVRQAALLAIGRIGDPSPIDGIVRIISSRHNPVLRKQAAFALSLLEDEVSPKILSQNLAMHRDPGTLAALLTALARSGGEETVKLLAGHLEPGIPAEVEAGVAEGLGLLWSKDSETWAVPAGLLARLTQMASGTGDGALFAAFALSRFKGGAAYLPGPAVIQAAKHAKSVAGKALLFKVLRYVPQPEARELLRSAFMESSHAPVRIEAVKSLAHHTPDPLVRSALIQGLGDPDTGVVYETLQTITTLRANDDPTVAALLRLWRGSRSPWLRGTALKALAELKPAVARAEMEKVLAGAKHPAYRYAVVALGLLGEKGDVNQLVKILANPASPLLVKSAAIQGLMHVDPVYLDAASKKALRDRLREADPGHTTLIAQMISHYGWRDFSEDLKTVYPLLTKPEHLEAKIAVLTAIAQVGDGSHAALVQSAFKDPDKLVVETAARTMETLTSKNHQDKVPANSTVRTATPTFTQLRQAGGRQVILKTNRGEIHFRLLPEAPMTAYHFMKLVKESFYNGSIFHRVVPNFVVQGGDPRGDGYGGPGYFIRDEPSLLRHERGTVGIATAGKDTGGSQFFINLGPNHHLNRRYTVFAKVTQGMAVVDRLEEGDRILSAAVK